ncbi:ATP-dependent DNA helicase RecG [Woeseiaceae bacterium]|nr:ATP-dependent DNA helicase RecG [Woeseiaceae bacterium]
MHKSYPSLDSPLTVLSGVGPSIASKLARLGLHHLEDLLFLLPNRYEDRTTLVKIGSLQVGKHFLVSGKVLLSDTVYRGRRNLLVRISDDTGQLTLRFFHYSKQQQIQFKIGVVLSCFGDVRIGPLGLEMVHPEYRILKPNQELITSDALTPIYPTTEGVQQGRLRNLTSQVIKIARSSPPEELLSDELRQKYNMPALFDALLYLHQPPPDTDIANIDAGNHPCQQRLAFEEFLAHHLSLRNLRDITKTEGALQLSEGSELAEHFINGLPYTLTAAQQRVINEITSDIATPYPMLRLIQGDVGSGKTVVAAVACLKAVASGVQIAVMAPTELLAEQHYQNFSVWFRPLGIEPTRLSGSQSQVERRKSLEAIATGNALLIIGTHALFQEGVTFKQLALVIIDEQHRFGVHQRMALRKKGERNQKHPHQLVMTATPIPRTLAMTAYANLDISIIDELPPGRQSVQTIAIPETRRNEVIERVRSSCKTGQQAYWVCPLIEESNILEYQAVETSYKMLTEVLLELQIGLIHGRMKPVEKEKVMRAFKNGKIQLLVATTVIEVGVDVPNASIMIIENAERMGLSQLHQLRGRVGRGDTASLCIMLYRLPLGKLARNRLAVLRDTSDGFLVAQRDLELRGPGELLGTRQTGLPQYRIANLIRDAELIPKVQLAAESIRRSPSEKGNKIIRRWLGDAGQYGKV